MQLKLSTDPTTLRCRCRLIQRLLIPWNMSSLRRSIPTSSEFPRAVPKVGTQDKTETLENLLT